jgi:hypothetical protein
MLYKTFILEHTIIKEEKIIIRERNQMIVNSILNLLFF